MRVSPLAIHPAALPPEQIARLAREDAAITHPNPVCGDASAVFCVAIGNAITTGSAPRDVHARTVSEAKALGLEPTVIRALERAAAERPVDFLSQQGWVFVTLQEAFFQLLQRADARGRNRRVRDGRRRRRHERGHHGGTPRRRAWAGGGAAALASRAALVPDGVLHAFPAEDVLAG
jgi:hypothetical protein